MIQPKIHGYRAVSALLILALFTSAISAAIFNKVANAAPMGTRLITMSNSRPGATGVTYSVSFNVSSTWSGNLDGIIVDFCKETPLIGDTNCTKPGSGTPTFSVPGTIGAGSFKVNSVAVGGTYTASQINTNRTFGLIWASGAHAVPTANQNVSFDITGVTNPDFGNHTFYARIYTYNASAGVGNGTTGYTLANPGLGATVIDTGGVALSTANELLITAKVQERLTFCITVAAGTCTAGSGATTNYQNTIDPNRQTGITLGDVNGVLDSSKQFGKKAKMWAQTNAQGNVAVVMRGETLCSVPMQPNGLGVTTACTGNSIAAMGAAASTGTVGTAQFGMCIDPTGASTFTIPVPYGSNTAGTDGAQNCASGYDDTTGNAAPGTAQYAFDGANARSATGTTVASIAPGPMNSAAVAFMANISNTTKAGIYTSTLQFVATGSY